MNRAENITSNITSKLSTAMNDNPNSDIKVTIAKDKKRNMKPLTPFVIVFYKNLDEILKTYKLSNFEMRVLLKLVDCMQYGNLISVNQKSIADALESSRQQVNRAFKSLKKTGLFIEVEGSLFMNYNIITKGDLWSAKDVKEIYEEAYRLTIEKQLKIAF